MCVVGWCAATCAHVRDRTHTRARRLSEMVVAVLTPWYRRHRKLVVVRWENESSDEMLWLDGWSNAGQTNTAQ